MQIKRLELIGFRNYEARTFEFSNNNLIVGVNGTGKTSILEAIDLLAKTKSSIARGINKCIQQGRKGFIISAVFADKKQAEMKLVFKQEKNVRKIIKLNENILPRTSELLGVVNSVIFLPNDIEIIQGSPQRRRKYLDILISQLSRDYYQQLQKYSGVLKQRNETLKSIRENRAGAELLEVWDEQLAALMENIYKFRQEYIQKISARVARIFGEIGAPKNGIELSYKPKTTGDKNRDLVELRRSRTEEIRYGHTEYGIHQDDLSFLLNKNNVADFCSQGQQRLLAVSLKLAEAELKQEALDDAPILLIDDVLLEMDLQKFNRAIQQALQKCQVIITVTDLNRFDPSVLAKMTCIELTGAGVV